MMSAEPVVGQGVGDVDLSKRVIVLYLRRHRPSLRCKVRSEDVVGEEDGVDPDSIHVSKDILRSETHKAIQKLDSGIRDYLLTREAPCEIVRDGYWMLPLSISAEADARLDEYEAARATLVDRLVSELPEIKAEARERLGPHYDEGDYPEPAKLKAAFAVERRYIAFEVPTSLRSVSRAIYEREKAAAAKMWRAANKEIAAALRAEFKGYVDHVLGRLEPDVNGERKILRGDTLEKLSEFLKVFPYRNVVDDAGLAHQVSRCQAMLRGVDVESLRDDDSFRAQVRERFESIKKVTDALVVEMPVRAIAFEEE